MIKNLFLVMVLLSISCGHHPVPKNSGQTIKAKTENADARSSASIYIQFTGSDVWIESCRPTSYPFIIVGQHYRITIDKDGDSTFMPGMFKFTSPLQPSNNEK